MIKDLLKNTVKILKETFSNLFNYKYTRKKHEVLGFYLVYTFLIILVAAIINGIITVFIYHDSIDDDVLILIQYMAEIVVPIASVILVSILSALILISKKIYKEKGPIIITVIAILTTPLFSAVVGCVPLTLLTTFENKNTEK